MDDVFGGLNQPEPSDFGAQDFTAAMPSDSRASDDSGLADTPSAEVPEYATIELDSHPGHGAAVSCGDWITGHASWSSKQNIRSVNVALEFFTEGRGTTDKATVGQMNLASAANGSAPIRFQVPSQGPMSYFGDMITLRWQVTLTLDVPRRRDTTTSLPITVMPHPG